MKNRQDAWMEEDDLLLADTVLRHVREGSTQLNAFEEVGDKLDRTSAACGFRWNAVVRQQYEQALSLAKRQRKQRSRLLGQDHSGKKKILYQPQVEISETPALPFTDESIFEKPEETHEMETAAEMFIAEDKPVSSLSLETVIAYLQQLARSNTASSIGKWQSERLSKELKVWQDKCRELEQKVRQLEANESTMKEDYETLMQIMNRARKLVAFSDQESSNTFKMDRNGNLEKVAEH
ncbi:RsfA family transcriptional regulator [Jeotgalibacillus aurantiacus]|uniref:RsfA family transcriptional regulator n=1 Tax=Jeotgalibacillus aurantiacus TaxID=2763266 RepID=UPI001D0A325D|nr:RsfA family transcriptional regulator [Jeotgalibacillus aurantiacus]